MARTFTPFLSFVLIFSLIASPLFANAAKKDGFDKGATASELRNKYESGKIKILIAAGHEPNYGGAVYQGVYEREIVVEVANELKRLLSENPKYEVIVTRDNSKWNKSIAKNFTSKETKATEKSLKALKKKMAKLIKKGVVDGEDDSHGVAAPADVAMRLYGINRWANENKVDLIVNLHVNDAPDHGPSGPSKYTGYAIYVPDSIFGNSKASKELGNDIADRLEALSDKSTHPLESDGVIEHRDFIAVGAFGTLNVPSVLVEYGYISEPRFTLPEHRSMVTKDTAYQTYLAIQDFFDDEVANPRKVAKLPTTWPKPVIATTTPPVATTTPVTIPVATTTPVTPAVTDTPAATACAPFTETILPAKSEADVDTTGVVKRLQAILAKDKTIYPEGLVTGYFGPATLRAVQAFQKKNNIVTLGTPETTGYGAVGPKTAKALLALCSQ